ncbi:hypothetical protein [Microbispora sp. ATCC PTA-5024]|uniref:hypothetical protein n=1 Tax=Microbispora sp. ATCC PTA-5024 TaxID=316330 RepID=UPI0003DDEEA2|nr:hypothetical protein [Microbispora sp. ATCC PTA-5024]ETK31154.1 hypothetical protein MPTA5024_36485 [Microbispora sp. ATCC PTA-5024]
MTDQADGRRGGARNARRLAAVALTAAAWAAVPATAHATSPPEAAPPAQAAQPALAAVAGRAAPPAHAVPARGGGDGGATNVNAGKAFGNKGFAVVDSPALFRGDENLAISISGQTNTQAGFCRKKVERCLIDANTWLSRHGRGGRHH